jgi:hypothetical protein
LTGRPDDAEIPVIVTLEWTSGFELAGEEYYATIYVPIKPEDSKLVILILNLRKKDSKLL